MFCEVHAASIADSSASGKALATKFRDEPRKECEDTRCGSQIHRFVHICITGKNRLFFPVAGSVKSQTAPANERPISERVSPITFANVSA